MTIPGIPFQNPLSYTGIPQNVVPIKVFYREPTATDKKFPIGYVAIIGANPTTGTKGDLWYLSEFDSSGNAVWLQFLTGASSPGIDSITTDEGAPAVEPDGNGDVNILGGTGVRTTGQGPGNTVTISVMGMGLTWSVIQTATKTIDVGEGYFADRGGGVVFTLPSTAMVGDSFAISNVNAGGWTLAQNAGQSIRIGNQATTVGAGGSLASTANGDTITVVCSIQDTNFQVVSSMGNITFV